MIRCTIDLHVIEETDDAYWISTATACEYQDVTKLPYIDGAAEAREELRNRGHVTRRMDKSETRPIREFIQEMVIGYQCSVEQVTQWPEKICLAKETT